jgi:hypothetical protein
MTLVQSFMRLELYYDNGIFRGAFGSLIIARREARDELGCNNHDPRRDLGIGIEDQCSEI